MRTLVLALALGAFSDACMCAADCGGFPPSYISVVRATVSDSNALSIVGAKVSILGSSREQVDAATTDSLGIAFITHVMFANPESVAVVVQAPPGSLVGSAVRAILRHADTTQVRVTLEHS
jgi:hypothetical protein